MATHEVRNCGKDRPLHWSSERECSVDASDLGLDVNEWPDFIAVNGMLFRRNDNDLFNSGYMMYRSEYSLTVMNVYND